MAEIKSVLGTRSAPRSRTLATICLLWLVLRLRLQSRGAARGQPRKTTRPERHRADTLPTAAPCIVRGPMARARSAGAGARYVTPCSWVCAGRTPCACAGAPLPFIHCGLAVLCTAQYPARTRVEIMKLPNPTLPKLSFVSRFSSSTCMESENVARESDAHTHALKKGRCVCW